MEEFKNSTSGGGWNPPPPPPVGNRVKYFFKSISLFNLYAARKLTYMIKIRTTVHKFSSNISNIQKIKKITYYYCEMGAVFKLHTPME